jgi:hypothetical protein
MDVVDKLGAFSVGEPHLLAAEVGECPIARRPPRRSEGSARVAITNVHVALQPIDRVVELRPDLEIPTTGLCRRCRADPASDGSAADRAATTRRQKRSGSSSSRSSDSYATRAAGGEATHSATAFVFPSPHSQRRQASASPRARRPDAASAPTEFWSSEPAARFEPTRTAELLWSTPSVRRLISAWTASYAHDPHLAAPSSDVPDQHPALSRQRRSNGAPGQNRSSSARS